MKTLLLLALAIVPAAPYSVGPVLRKGHRHPQHAACLARRCGGSLASTCISRRPWHLPSRAGSLRHCQSESNGASLRMSGYPNLDFDFESAAEDSSSNDAVDVEGDMLEVLRDEALQFLEVPMLRAQMQKHIMSRYSLAEMIASILASKLASPDLSEALLFETLVSVMRRRPQLSLDAVKDLQWCKECDPATIGYLQPLLYFKGVHAVLLQRIEHQLWSSGDARKKMLALSLQGRGSEVFGVDAHPGAIIKHAVMLDHATGVVIGETGTIGYECYILHSVTLGSTGKGDAFDRHPKIGNRVKIGAGAKVLGNVKIGSEAFIGAGAIVTVNIKEGDTVVGINRVLDSSAKKANMNESNKDTWLYTI